MFANGAEVGENFVVRYAQHGQTVFLEKGCALGVFFGVCGFIMLRAVKLHYKLGRGAIKIRDVFAEHFLS